MRSACFHLDRSISPSTPIFLLGASLSPLDELKAEEQRCLRQLEACSEFGPVCRDEIGFVEEFVINRPIPGLCIPILNNPGWTWLA